MGSKLKLSSRRGALTARAVAVYALVGFVVGMAGGYIFMGTTHAILETRGGEHYRAEGGEGGQEQQQQAAKAGSGAQQQQQQVGGGKAAGNAIHTLCTSNGSPYQNYQTRIAYATYKLMAKMPGGEQHVAFTRILHRQTPDVLMEEVPTFRADPLQPKCDDWCDYPVSDRGNAVRQFFDAVTQDPGLLKAPWIYMVESDYVFMKPLPAPDAASRSVVGWSFDFDYINPLLFPEEMKVLYPKGPASDIQGTGPAPVLLRAVDWMRIIRDWERLTAVIEGSAEMQKKLGWVREMYAFSAALALHGLKLDMPPPPENPFIVQLPIDSTLGKAHAFHYTQCTIYKGRTDDSDVWKYDKRFYTSQDVVLSVPRIEEPPEVFVPGAWKFVEGNPVTQDKHEAIRMMIKRMNEGIDTLKPLH